MIARGARALGVSGWLVSGLLLSVPLAIAGPTYTAPGGIPGITAAGTALVTAADAAAQTALLSAATTTTAGIAKVRAVALPYVTAVTIFTNLPAAYAEGSTGWRTRVDLSNYSEYRLSVRQTAASAGDPDFCVGYTTDVTGATGWTHLDGTSIASECELTGGYVALPGAGANAVGAWTSLTAAAKADVLLGLYYGDGDGAADPSIVLALHFR